MKKTLFLLFLLLLSFSVYAGAENDGEIFDGTFSIASYQTTLNLVKDEAGLEKLYTSIDWLAEQKEELDLRMVSFVGNLTNGSVTQYKDYVTNGGHTSQEYITYCLSEENWVAEWDALSGAVHYTSSLGIPVSVATGKKEYPGRGFARNNLLSDYFTLDDVYINSNIYDFYDDANHYYCFNAEGYKYMVVTLEVYPRQGVLTWLDQVMKEKSDYKTILITSSFLKENGELYSAWRWEDRGAMTANEFMSKVILAPSVTSKLSEHNYCWTDNPRDGDALWDYSFKKYSNIIAILSSFGTPKDKIVTKILKNDDNNEVAAILASTSDGIDSKYATPLITKISNKGTSLDLYYVDGDFNIIEPTRVKIDLVRNDADKGLAGEEDMIEKPQMKKQFLGSNTAYIFGYEDNTFRPQAYITRAEACTIIARLLDPNEKFKGSYVSAFGDLKNTEWYYDYISYLEHFGFLDRFSGSYHPNQPITRAEFAELAFLSGGITEGLVAVSFGDVINTHPYYEAIYAAASSGLVNGYEDNTFRPDSTITRAEVVTIVNRVLDLSATPGDLEGVTATAFEDISGHWARTNIIIASTSNLVTNKEKRISLDGITDTESEIIIENDDIKYVISKNNAKVTSFINKAENKNIIANSDNPYFCYLFTETNPKIVPLRARFENKRIIVTFRDGVEIAFIAQSKDRYLTFEVDSEIPKNYFGLSFAKSTLNFKVNNDDDFGVIGYAMSANVNPTYYPDAKSNTVVASCISEIGTKGAKFAVIASPKREHRDIMKLVNTELPENYYMANSIGGANALDRYENDMDYVILSDSAPDKIDDYIDLYRSVGIEQFDFHQGARTFRNGDFYFYLYDGLASNFKKAVSDRLNEQGIMAGLHTYSFYISYNADTILSDPKWQKDLDVLKTLTLKGDLSSLSTTIDVVEGMEGLPTSYSFLSYNSPYILIDEELIKITIGKNGFVNCIRAQGGTKAVKHSAGAKVKVLAGYFNLLAPIPGSDLFYEIARNTAKTYNEGGFGMIYLDALDGMYKHCGSQKASYYTTLFVNEILKYCETPPVLEYSQMFPSLWNARSRMGAADIPIRGFKTFQNLHIDDRNAACIDYYYPTTLGWYHFYPFSTKLPPNYFTQYTFIDDIDHLGMLAIAYNSSMSYNQFTRENIEKYPAMKRNIDHYQLYNKLRKTKYFPDAIRQKLRENDDKDYKLFEKSEGVYVFREMYYAQNKVFNTADPERNTVKLNNPFEAQKPVVRIEALLSSEGNDPITLISFDQTKPLKGQPMTNKFQSSIGDNLALKVTVKGNNSSDAICIRVNSSIDYTPLADYRIDLDFEGEREFILAEVDNSPALDVGFAGKTVKGWNYYRFAPDYTKITTVEVFLKGECTGVSMSSVTATDYIKNKLVNPTIKVNDQSITFACELMSTEYLEYTSGDTATVYDEFGNARSVPVTGEMPTINSGEAKVTLSAQSTQSVGRAKLTLGFVGEELK